MVSSINALPEPEANVVTHLSTTATRVLWHQRLGRVHHRNLSELHKHVKGILNITMPLDVDSCSTCIMSKIRRADRGSHGTRKDATIAGQEISMDWGFICQRSKNLERYERLSGLNGETAYLITTDHKTDYILGLPADGKASPLVWLKRWVAQYAPADAPFRYCALYQGGELYHNMEVVALLAYHRYTPRPTGGDASWQNSLGERPHITIAYLVNAMLHGAGMGWYGLQILVVGVRSLSGATQ
jgi:hypothetical protein